jgi:hypothetical protein
VLRNAKGGRRIVDQLSVLALVRFQAVGSKRSMSAWVDPKAVMSERTHQRANEGDGEVFLEPMEQNSSGEGVADSCDRAAA